MRRGVEVVTRCNDKVTHMACEEASLGLDSEIVTRFCKDVRMLIVESVFIGRLLRTAFFVHRCLLVVPRGLKNILILGRRFLV